MARVVSFVYCENIQNEIIMQNGQAPQQVQKAHLIGPLLNLNLISIPGNFSFSFSVGIQGFDIKTKNSFQLKFIDPSGTVLHDTNLIEVPQNMPNVEVPEGAEGLQINLDVRNMIFNTEGDYKMQVYFNAELLGEYPILVIKGVR